MARFDGTVAVITGAAQGIGATFAQAFAQSGARVVVVDIDAPDQTVQKIHAAGGEALSFRGDITDSAFLGAMVADVEGKFGPIGVLVNNASIFASLRLQPFTEISDEEWDRVMRVNVRGGMQCVKAVLPSMERQGQGRIVNISSGSFFYGAPGMMHYVASKGAVIGMTRCLARELGDRNILVNAVAPGFTESEGVKANADMAAIRAPTLAMRMIKRNMEPDDLVGVVLFLASADNSFITGQVINVDGGRTTY